jgi:transposase
MSHDIVLAVDYHDENTVVRQFDERTGVETIVTVPTSARGLRQVVDQAAAVARRRRGKVVWIQESTTGWARVKALFGDRVTYILANVLQMPRPPKGHRRKTDCTDTARMLREYRNGNLPQADQPSDWYRQVRRLVGLRENLVARRTALRNWINRYLAHETWESRANLWSEKGQAALERLVSQLPPLDGLVVGEKLNELQRLAEPLSRVECQMHALYRQWPEAQQIDVVRGVSVIAAVSLAARIGAIKRFRNADSLIAYAGLAPGVRQSDQTRRDGHIGGGGTDHHLRYYLIEASLWARDLPRYRATYERVAKRRGKKIGRLVVARLLVRSIYKVLHDGVPFDGERRPSMAAVAAGTR